MCEGSSAKVPYPPSVGYAACAQTAKDPMGGYTFEQSLRRRRAELQERQARIGQKIQLLSELLRVFEED